MSEIEISLEETHKLKGRDTRLIVVEEVCLQTLQSSL